MSKAGDKIVAALHWVFPPCRCSEITLNNNINCKVHPYERRLRSMSTSITTLRVEIDHLHRRIEEQKKTIRELGKAVEEDLRLREQEAKNPPKDIKNKRFKDIGK